MGIHETLPLSGQSINVWRFDFCGSVSPGVTGTHIISEDHNNVWRGGRGLGRIAGKRCESSEGESDRCGV
jgi:hypothetical protein